MLETILESILSWVVPICEIVAIIVIRQTRWADKKKADGLIRFIAADGLLLIMDIVFAGFQGQSSLLAFHVVAIAKLLVFVTGYLLIISGVAYFGDMIEQRVGVSIRNWKAIEYGIGVVGLIMVSLNIAFPYLYRFR